MRAVINFVLAVFFTVGCVLTAVVMGAFIGGVFNG